MKKIVLKPEPLTAEAFAPFGDVIQVGDSPIMINEGTTERHHKLSMVELDGPQSQSVVEGEKAAIINIFRAQPRPMPMPIKMMERHPLGSQAFLPTNDKPYLVLVCLGEKAPDPETLKLFLVEGPSTGLAEAPPSVTGVSYKANCWHHPLLALNEVTDFWVVDRMGPGNNLEEQDFDSDLEIEIQL